MKLLLKTLVFLFILSTFFVTAKGQVTKNNWLVGGSGSFYSSNSTYKTSNYYQESEEFNLGISPSIGYFLADKLAAGLRPSFSWGKGEVTTTGGLTTNTKKFLIGPFVRYYLLSTEKPFNILTEANYQYGLLSFTPGKGSANNFSIAAGPVIYFNSSVGLEFTLGYVAQTEDAENSYKTTRKGLQIGIGFQIHLEKE